VFLQFIVGWKLELVPIFRSNQKKIDQMLRIILVEHWKIITF